MKKPSEYLKPGMIGVALKGSFDPMGTLDTVLQGDTKASHVWYVLPNGRIATTGAEWLVLYGDVDPDTYLQGKSFYLLETVDPLTPIQLEIIRLAHEELKKAGAGRIYGIWKFAVLWGITVANGAVDKTGKDIKTGRPTCPICSQAVAYPFWKAGVPIGRSQGKVDWTAVLPETILHEAMDTAGALQAGWMNGRTTPCYLLTTVQPEPFHF